MCVSRGLLALLEHQLRRAFGMLLPELLDLVVRLLPFGDRRPPVAEDGVDLGRRPLLARDRQDLADVRRQRVGRRRPARSVTERRNRPRLLFWLSSLFQPP